MNNKMVVNNAEWLSVYNSEVEISRIVQLIKIQSISFLLQRAIDIGCGNGRSVKLLRKLFPSAQIIAIDKCSENINFACNCIQDNNVNYQCKNVLDFFPSEYMFDFALFSWSLFDMSNTGDSNKKCKELREILDRVLASIRQGGMVLVLQPTKGGNFERLLSKFIPGSDADYFVTHKFLREYGFTGPNEAVPSKDDQLAIWSSFDYKDEEQLFRGIASVLMLEREKKLKYKTFIKRLNEFKIENGLRSDQQIQLTDCVNIYYLIKEY
jgi:SAM-dependent methyltransferase